MLTQPIYIQRASATFLLSADICMPTEPDYKQWIPNATLRRRMSRVVRMGVATGLQCLEGVKDTPVDAILTATGLGCLADTEKFMDTILDNDERLLAPTAFIQSTFNIIGAQIALLTGNHGYNSTYVHRGFSFESALLDAALLLQEGEASTVLAGAVDEMTPALHTILGRMGCWKKTNPGEGAAFFLLSGELAADSRVAIQDMEMFSGTYPDSEIDRRMADFLSENDESDALILRPEAYKCYCGEYPTAISFAIWYASRRMEERGFAPSVLLYNSLCGNHSFILLKRV